MHMYRYHQDAQLLESKLTGGKSVGSSEDAVPMITESVSEKDGVITVTLGNLSATEAEKVQLKLQGRGYKVLEAKIVSGADIHSHNTFDDAQAVTEREFSMDGLTVKLPAASVVMVRLQK